MQHTGTARRPEQQDVTEGKAVVSSVGGQSAEKSLLEKCSEWLLRSKEVLLIATGLSYTLGLVLWQWFAYRYSLGHVSALNSQYFAAGAWVFIATCLLFVGAGAFVWLLDLTKSFGDRIESNWHPQTATAKILKQVIVGAYTAFVIAILVACGWTALDRKLQGYWLWIIVVAVEAISIGWFSFRLVSGRRVTTGIWLQRTQKNAWLILVSALACLVLYSECIYPFVPQEIGGGKPKTCYLDLELSKMSDRMICELGSTGKTLKLTGTEDQQYDQCKAALPDIIGRTQLTWRSRKSQEKSDPKSNPANARSMTKHGGTTEAAMSLSVLHTKELELWFNSTECMIVRVRSVFTSPDTQQGPEYTIVRIPSNLFMAITIHRHPYGGGQKGRPVPDL
jgi:hypothetical protein